MTEIQLFKKISQTTLLIVFLIYGALSHAQIERFVAGTPTRKSLTRLIPRIRQRWRSLRPSGTAAPTVFDLSL